MDVIRDDIRDAIEKELVGANERFPLFASQHEAIAVIAEERDEAIEALENMCNAFVMAWTNAKNDHPSVLQHITRMKYAAEDLAVEACQVAAMCEKAVQSADSWNDEREGNKKC